MPTLPTDYRRTATFVGNVGAFRRKLDPRRWQINAPELWNQAYLVATPAVPPSVLQGPASSLATSALDLDPDRTRDPPRHPNPGALNAWGPPGDGLFFEDVRVAGFRYRNVLKTSFVDNSQDPVAPSITFTYDQYDCLNTTDSEEPADGGIDVDVGFSECIPDPDNPGHVRIRIAKRVRFTQPAYCVDELNALATILVPLTFDSWLHDLVFS
ncbi:MAG TPA: hypothetical protein VN903_27540 [Polyangia bacterium]|jgi:hypothetical protein|nr:hypothetical protein [Polyangia bacterium]